MAPFRVIAFFVVCFSLLPLSSAVTIDPSTGILCPGTVANWTCSTNGTTTLAWLHRTSTEFYTNPNSLSPPSVLGAGPIYTSLTCICGSLLMSTATVDVTTGVIGDLNETSLQCADGFFGGSNTTTETVNLIVRDISSISLSLEVKAMPNSTILVSWTGGECISHYQVLVNGENVLNETQATQYSHSAVDPAVYNFTVIGFDFLGRTTDASKSFNYTSYTFNIQTIVEDDEIINAVANLSIYIQEASAIDQPPLLSCYLTINNTDGFQLSGVGCSPGITKIEDVTRGTNYCYEVMTNNAVGPWSEDGCVDIDSINSSVRVSPSPTSPSSDRISALEEELFKYQFGLGLGLALALTFVCAVVIALIGALIIKCVKQGKHSESRVSGESLETLTDEQITKLIKSELSKRPEVAKMLEVDTRF